MRNSSLSDIKVFSSVILPVTFFRHIFLNIYQQNSEFFISHINFCEKIFFQIISALFQIFKCICSKNRKFLIILPRTKQLFFWKYLSVSVWIPPSFEIWTPLVVTAIPIVNLQYLAKQYYNSSDSSVSDLA